ncbi:uncharacterized protein LOC135195784 [Macrobrachium nipponense]|uniref:uncharacterized protein LOC135195784 n=1 Tax=Macrobrachium nipponense TaxID=159736 RepID=UPI0030C85E95
MISIVILSLLGVCIGSPLAQQAYETPLYREPPQNFQERERYPSPQANQYRADPPKHQNRYEKEPQYDEDEEQNLNTIPGEPGKDYPVHAFIPNTGFSCSDRLPGFYADDTAHCQVWHYCKTDGLMESFLCPNGTIYNQENRVCEWWFNVNCDKATIAAQAKVNEDLYIVPPPYKGDLEYEVPQKYSGQVAQRRYRQEPEYQEGEVDNYPQYEEQPRY